MFESANMTINVSQMDRSLAFYTGVLGFTLKRRIGSGVAVLEHPGLTLLLQERRGQPSASARGSAIGLWVKDLGEARRTVEARGVSIEGEPVETPEFKIAFFSDPDGTPLYLAEASAII